MDEFQAWVRLHRTNSASVAGSVAGSDAPTVRAELEEVEQIQPIPIDEAGNRCLLSIPADVRSLLVETADPRIMESDEPVYSLGTHPPNSRALPHARAFTDIKDYDFGISEHFKVMGLYPTYRRRHQDRGASSAQTIFRQILLLLPEGNSSLVKRPYDRFDALVRNLAISEGFDFVREPNSLLGGERWIRFIQKIIRLPWFDQRIAQHIARYSFPNF